jgi:hypothetical protein
LEEIPGVLEAFVTTGAGDMLCRVAAASHLGLQELLVRLNKSAAVARTTSVVVLSVLVPYRAMPLLSTVRPHRMSKAPAFREGAQRG